MNVRRIEIDLDEKSPQKLVKVSYLVSFEDFMNYVKKLTSEELNNFSERRK